MSLAWRIALLHPAVLTSIWVLFGILSFIAPLWQFVPSLVLISMICGWAWAIYAISTERAPQESHPRWTSWIFLAPPLLAVIAKIFHLSTSNSPESLLFFATFLFGLWRAAQALEYADRQEKPVTVGRILETMVLMFFAIVGAWRLRPKISRVSGALPG
jgi:hypothetical protein